MHGGSVRELLQLVVPTDPFDVSHGACDPPSTSQHVNDGFAQVAFVESDVA